MGRSGKECVAVKLLKSTVNQVEACGVGQQLCRSAWRRRERSRFREHGGTTGKGRYIRNGVRARPVRALARARPARALARRCPPFGAEPHVNAGAGRPAARKAPQPACRGPGANDKGRPRFRAAHRGIAACQAAPGLAGRAFRAFSAVIALRAPSSVRKRRRDTFRYFANQPVAASSHVFRRCNSRHNPRIRSGCA